MALWTPAELGARLVAWFDAKTPATLTFTSGNAASGGAISNWASRVGSKVAATQGPMQTYVPNGGMPYVNFGGDTWMAYDQTGLPAGGSEGAVGGLAQSMSNFAFAHGYGNTGTAEFRGLGSSDGDNLGGFRNGADTTVSGYGFRTVPRIVLDIERPSLGWTRSDGGTGQNQSARSIVTNNNQVAAIGRLAANVTGADFNGNIYELFVINGALNDDEIYRLEGYLAWRWGRQATLPANHAYKSAAPETTAASSGVGAASGVAQVSGSGAAWVQGAGASAGVGSVTGKGAARTSATGASAGASGAYATSQSGVNASATASGTSTAQASGATVVTCNATASGAGGATAIGRSMVVAVGTAAGGSTATAYGTAPQAIVGTGTSAGVSQVVGVSSSQAIAIGSGSSSAAAQANGQGQSVASASGVAAGAALVIASGCTISAGRGNASGAAAAEGSPQSQTVSAGSSIGRATVAGAGSWITTARGTASGVSAVIGVARLRDPLPSPASRTVRSPHQLRTVATPRPSRLAA